MTEQQHDPTLSATFAPGGRVGPPAGVRAPQPGRVPEVPELVSVVSQALSNLNDSIERLDHQAARLIERTTPAMSPSAQPPVEATPKDPNVPQVSALVSAINSAANRISAIRTVLGDAADRVEL